MKLDIINIEPLLVPLSSEDKNIIFQTMRETLLEMEVNLPNRPKTQKLFNRIKSISGKPMEEWVIWPLFAFGIHAGMTVEEAVMSDMLHKTILEAFPEEQYGDIHTDLVSQWVVSSSITGITFKWEHIEKNIMNKLNEAEKAKLKTILQAFEDEENTSEK